MTLDQIDDKELIVKAFSPHPEDQEVIRYEGNLQRVLMDMQFNELLSNPEVQKKYKGKHVLIVNGEIIQSAEEKDSLYPALQETKAQDYSYIEQVGVSRQIEFLAPHMAVFWEPEEDNHEDILALKKLWEKQAWVNKFRDRFVAILGGEFVCAAESAKDALEAAIRNTRKTGTLQILLEKIQDTTPQRMGFETTS